MKTIYVLSTSIIHRKNYVATLMHNRSDNKKIVNYTTHPGRAKDFGSLEDAEKFIEKIVNPHERIFTAEAVEVDERDIAPMEAILDEDIK